jgi:hypothetical protein
MQSFIIFVVSFLLGICFTRLCTKYDGRLVIDEDEYFVAITTKTEDLSQKNRITLRVINK